MFLQTCTCVVTSKDSITRLAAVNRKMTTVINVTVHILGVKGYHASTPDVLSETP